MPEPARVVYKGDLRRLLCHARGLLELRAGAVHLFARTHAEPLKHSMSCICGAPVGSPARGASLDGCRRCASDAGPFADPWVEFLECSTCRCVIARLYNVPRRVVRSR